MRIESAIEKVLPRQSMKVQWTSIFCWFSDRFSRFIFARIPSDSKEDKAREYTSSKERLSSAFRLFSSKFKIIGGGEDLMGRLFV
jgi:hypothetical protein